MAYELPPLPYAYDALEPHIDEATQRFHHDKHHATYVARANEVLEGTEWADKPVEELLKNLDKLPADKLNPLRNNAGGHYNHTLWWESLSPDGGGEPTGELAEAINAAFGSFAEFQAKLEAAGAARFGSGWAWLVTGENGLEVISTPNQDTPLAEGKTPLFGVDVWEHAYYLKYQNLRPAYLKAVWNVVNWDKVAERYAAAS